MSETTATGFKPYKRFLLSLGGLSSVVECFFALFAYYYLSEILPPYAVALTGGLTAAAAIALVPAMHATVNRMRLLSLGRYHGVLIVSSLLTPLAAAVLFNIDPAGGMAYKAATAAAALFVLFLSVQTFSYAVYSITARVADGRQSRLGYLMNGAGALAVIVLTFFCFDYTEPATAGRMAYIASCITLLAGMSVYFSTFTQIPKLIRTEPALFAVREDYKRFFIRPRPVARLYLGRYFFTAALVYSAMQAAEIVRAPEPLAIALTIAAAGGTAVRLFVRPRSAGKVKTTAAAATVLYALSVAALLIGPYVLSSDIAALLVLVWGAALAQGVAYGLTAAAQKGYMAAALRLTNATRGTHKCMTGILSCAAAGTAVVLSGVHETLAVGLPGVSGNVAARCVLAAVAVLMMTAGFIFSEKGAKYADFR